MNSETQGKKGTDDLMGEHIESLLRGIYENLKRIDAHLEKLNGKVAEHEGTLREWNPFMEGADDRFASIERAIDQLERIDAEARGVREAALRDIAEVRAVMKEHQEYIAQDRGGNNVRVQDVGWAITIVVQAAVLIKLFFFRG